MVSCDELAANYGRRGSCVNARNAPVGGSGQPCRELRETRASVSAHFKKGNADADRAAFSGTVEGLYKSCPWAMKAR
jgi:hypothetical protein